MFRFTIRDVLWLTVVVGLGAGWWLELKNRGPENVKLRNDISRLLVEHEKFKDANEALVKYVNETNRGRGDILLQLLKESTGRLLEQSKERGFGEFEYMPAEPGEWQAKGRPTPR